MSINVIMTVIEYTAFSFYRLVCIAEHAADVEFKQFKLLFGHTERCTKDLLEVV